MKNFLLISFITATAGIVLTILAFVVTEGIVSYLLFAGILLIAISVFVFYLYTKRKDKKPPVINAEYTVKPSLLSVPEQDFYHVLSQVVSDKHMIVIQPAYITFIDKKTMTSYRNELFRVADFLIADRFTFKPLLVIELNDASHKRADRQLRDEKMSAILKNAGLPLLVVAQSAYYDAKELKKYINKLI